MSVLLLSMWYSTYILAPGVLIHYYTGDYRFKMTNVLRHLGRLFILFLHFFNLRDIWFLEKWTSVCMELKKTHKQHNCVGGTFSGTINHKQCKISLLVAKTNKTKTILNPITNGGLQNLPAQTDIDIYAIFSLKICFFYHWTFITTG